MPHTDAQSLARLPQWLEDKLPRAVTATCACGKDFATTRRLGLLDCERCPTCQTAHDLEIQAEAQKAEAEQLAAEARMEGYRRLALLEASGIDQALLSFQPKPALIEQIADSPRGAYVHGLTGVGKTVLVTHIVRRCTLDHGMEARYCHAWRLILELQATYRPSSPRSTLELVDELIDLPLLVLDDFGRQKDSVDAHGLLFNIIDERITRRRKTVYVAEMPLRSAANKLHDALVGRIMQAADIYHMTGKNWRLGK